MDFPTLIGIIGASCIVIAWIPETIRTLKTQRTGLSLGFNVIYILGSGLLTWYSVVLGDPVFIGLNAVATLLSLINLPFTFKEHAAKKKKEGGV